MRTIAVKERTFELLRDLKHKNKKASFDELMIELVHNKESSPKSLRGSLKGKAKRFTSIERKKIWKDKERIL